jgi:hypothetical protein
MTVATGGKRRHEGMDLVHHIVDKGKEKAKV